jgi:endonuclease/exonuclease/phosphatase family metal-dependent hydrolase
VTDTGAGVGQRVRVVSYNVHSCTGTDGVFSPIRIAEVLAPLDADFVALQEVEDREYDGKTVSEFLANSLGLPEAGRTTHKRAGIDYGNFLLSRAPPLETTCHDLAFSQREPRGAIEAKFAIGDRTLRLVATHFGLSMRERRSQLQTIQPFLENSAADLTILCADFNEWLPFSRVHSRLARLLGAAPAVRTFPSRSPVLSLDRVYASPAETLVSSTAVTTVDARAASDHLPVVADFDLARLDSVLQ